MRYFQKNVRLGIDNVQQSISGSPVLIYNMAICRPGPTQCLHVCALIVSTLQLWTFWGGASGGNWVCGFRKCDQAEICAAIAGGCNLDVQFCPL